MNVQQTIPVHLELLDESNNVTTLQTLLRGVEALVILFTPFTFDDTGRDKDGQTSKTNMEKLIRNFNKALSAFKDMDVRVICITREPPSTIRHWRDEKRIKMEVFSDVNLAVSAPLVGTFDLSEYLLTSKAVHLGSSYLVPISAAMVLDANGTIVSKYVASNPGEFLFISFKFKSSTCSFFWLIETVCMEFML